MPDKKTVIFLLISAAIFTDMMVYSLLIPVLPSYSMTLGADKVQIGIIFGSFSLALLVFSVPFGILSDRIGRWPFMVIGMLSLALTNVIFAFSGNLYVLIAARLLQGMSGAATWSAGLALIADTFEPSERGEKLGLVMAAMSLGTLSGPVLGGLLYDNLGYTYTFVVPSLIACDDRAFVPHEPHPVILCRLRKEQQHGADIKNAIHFYRLRRRHRVRGRDFRAGGALHARLSARVF